MTLPEMWVLLVPGVGVADESTGRTIPGPATEVLWTGLLQRRPLTVTAAGLGSNEFAPGHDSTGSILLLDPGITPMPSRRDSFRGPDGLIYTIQGTPRVRRPARRSRRPAYIAAQVHCAADLQEEP